MPSLLQKTYGGNSSMQAITANEHHAVRYCAFENAMPRRTDRRGGSSRYFLSAAGALTIGSDSFVMHIVRSAAITGPAVPVLNAPSAPVPDAGCT